MNVGGEWTESFSIGRSLPVSDIAIGYGRNALVKAITALRP